MKMSEKAVLSQTPTATGQTPANDNLATYRAGADSRSDKDSSKDKSWGLTPTEIEIGVGGAVLLVGGGYVASKALGDINSLNGQLGSLNSGIGKGLGGLNSEIKLGLGTLQTDLTGLEGTLGPALKSGLGSLAGIQGELGALNTNLGTLGQAALQKLGTLPAESAAAATPAQTVGHNLHKIAAVNPAVGHAIPHTLGESIHKVAIIPHVDYRTALFKEPVPSLPAGLGSIHGIGSERLKEQIPGRLHGVASAAEIHITEHATVLKPSHLKLK
jgi:hypothetical protein